MVGSLDGQAERFIDVLKLSPDQLEDWQTETLLLQWDLHPSPTEDQLKQAGDFVSLPLTTVRVSPIPPAMLMVYT